MLLFVATVTLVTALPMANHRHDDISHNKKIDALVNRRSPVDLAHLGMAQVGDVCAKNEDCASKNCNIHTMKCKKKIIKG